MSHPLYLNCRRCIEEGVRKGVTALVLDGDLCIVCNDEEHGLIHVQPFVGPELKCQCCNTEAT